MPKVLCNAKEVARVAFWLRLQTLQKCPLLKETACFPTDKYNYEDDANTFKHYHKLLNGGVRFLLTVKEANLYRHVFKKNTARSQHSVRIVSRLLNLSWETTCALQESDLFCNERWAMSHLRLLRVEME